MPSELKSTPTSTSKFVLRQLGPSNHSPQHCICVLARFGHDVCNYWATCFNWLHWNHLLQKRYLQQKCSFFTCGEKDQMDLSINNFLCTSTLISISLAHIQSFLASFCTQIIWSSERTFITCHSCKFFNSKQWIWLFSFFLRIVSNTVHCQRK